MQLCRQVERALAWALADEEDEPALLAATVAAVEPAPDASRMRVRVEVPAGGSAGMGAVRAALERRRGRWRFAVARSIHRKRVPELSFEVHLVETEDD